MKRTPFYKKRRAKFPMDQRSIGDNNIENPMAWINASKQLKQTPFTKKRKVVHKVSEPGRDAIKALEKKAAKLRSEIFNCIAIPSRTVKGWPCVLCLHNRPSASFTWNTKTGPHHILNKYCYDRLRFVLMNLLPLCFFHHRQAHDEEQEFRNFLQDRYPRHYRHYLNEKDKRTPVKQTVESLTKIVNELQDYADNPLIAEQVIYEKD